MIDAATQAIEYAQGRNTADLQTDPPLRALLLLNLEIIGEAASRISPELRRQYPDIPWQKMVSMRNRIVHAYFDLDNHIVWSTVKTFLPSLLQQLQPLLG